jgi:hypothetical protein
LSKVKSHLDLDAVRALAARLKLIERSVGVYVVHVNVYILNVEHLYAVDIYVVVMKMAA